MKPVSVVIPALGDVPLLRRAMKSLLLEFELRDVGDELVVVDDTGTGALERERAALIGEREGVRLITREVNGGFAEALTTGIEAARHDLVFSMNSDVVVRTGFLAPLSRALADDVFAVAPAALLGGDAETVESYNRARLANGLLDVRSSPGPAPTEGCHPVAFAVGGTMLFDRRRFAELGGFDPLFEPFYFEDVDLCWRAWRAGLRTLFCADAIVEHHHKGTIGRYLSEGRRRAAVERGELLFNWKHLAEDDLAEHLALLYRRTLDGYLTDRRDDLVWLSLALAKLDEVTDRRKGARERSTRDVLALEDGPGLDADRG